MNEFWLWLGLYIAVGAVVMVVERYLIPKDAKMDIGYGIIAGWPFVVLMWLVVFLIIKEK